MAAQRKKGLSPESARKYCGALEQKAREANKNASLEQLIASSSSFSILDNEPFDQKIKRIQDFYNIDEKQAKDVINNMIVEEKAGLEAEEYALLKQLKESKVNKSQ